MANYYRCVFCGKKFKGRGIRQHLLHKHNQPSNDRVIKTVPGRRGHRTPKLIRVSDGKMVASWAGSFKE